MQQIQGTVIHLDPAYLGKKDRSVWAVIGKLALALALLPILLPLWLLGFMFRGGGSRPGFLSQVGVRVTSFWLSMRLFGHNGDVMVRDFRVRDAAGRQRLVRIHGILSRGNLNVGDSVTIEGDDRGGTLEFRRGLNHTIQSALVVRSR
jgi:hypothetical protein